jgi:hypothetical protein
MATAWIHRANVSDILVRFPNQTAAYNFLVKLAKRYGDELTEIRPQPIYLPDDGYDIAQTLFMQLALHVAEFDGVGWNTDIVVVNPAEAEALGEFGEPVGFVPGESEAPWYPERRSAAELDEELESYMLVKELGALYTKALDYRDSFTPMEWWRIHETERDLVEYGQIHEAVNHWKNVIAQAKEAR